jgi:hypothetical protein
MLKLYTWCRPPAPQRAALPPLAPGISTLRFGHETLLYTEEEPPAFAAHSTTAARGSSSGRGTRLPQRYVDATPANLHLVVQNGRLFQQHHPEVPVLHDRGRFLLVSVDPTRAAELADPHGTCWGIRPLASEAV